MIISHPPTDYNVSSVNDMSIAGSVNATAPATGTAMLDEHPGTSDRPLLSVLLPFRATTAATIPPFVRSQSYPCVRSSPVSEFDSGSVLNGAARGYNIKPHKPTTRTSTLRIWEVHHADDDTMAPQSPFTSLFISPPSIAFHHRRTRSLLTCTSPYASLILLLFIFLLSTISIVLALSSLPIASLRHIPKTLSDISILMHDLQSYASTSVSGKLHVLFVLSLTAIWKHAWSIPGSVVLNVVAGVVLQERSSLMMLATIHMTLLTSVGSIFASVLSKPLGPVVSTFFPRALALTRSTLEGDRDEGSVGGLYNEKMGRMVSGGKGTPTWVRLVVMRLVGVVPWRGINVACGVAGVSLWDCFVGSFIGTLPWTAVTCQVCNSFSLIARLMIHA